MYQVKVRVFSSRTGGDPSLKHCRVNAKQNMPLFQLPMRFLWMYKYMCMEEVWYLFTVNGSFCNGVVLGRLCFYVLGGAWIVLSKVWFWFCFRTKFSLTPPPRICQKLETQIETEHEFRKKMNCGFLFLNWNQIGTYRNISVHSQTVWLSRNISNAFSTLNFRLPINLFPASVLNRNIL